MNNQRFFIIISITIVVIVALVLGLTLGLKKHGGSGGGDSGGGGDAGGDTTSGPGPKGNEISVTISTGDTYTPRWKDWKETLKLNVNPILFLIKKMNLFGSAIQVLIIPFYVYLTLFS